MSDSNDKQEEQRTLNEEVKRLMLERLKVISPGTIFSVGSETSVTRDELIQHVEEEDKIGKIFTEMQLEWLRSFKEAAEAA